jgi:hypothetical protein
MKLKKAIHSLSKNSVWSVDFIIYLLKKIGEKENKNISYVRKTYDTAGRLINEDVISYTPVELRNDLRKQEIDLENISERDVLDSLYRKILR